MTTYALSGTLMFLNTNGTAAWTNSVKEQISFTLPNPSTVFGFSYLDDPGSTAVTFTTDLLPRRLSDSVGYEVTLQGARMERLHWGDGKVSDVLLLGTTLADYFGGQVIVHLAGDALPALIRRADVKEFLLSVTERTRIDSGPVTPDQPIDLGEVPGVVVSENDQIDFSLGEKRVPFLYDGGEGNDTITGARLDDTLIGGTGADRLAGGVGHDSLVGDEGADGLFGDSGDDKLFGGSDSDRLEGGEGDDLLLGGQGDDRLIGGKGVDTLQGGSEDDAIYGGKNADVIIFEAGDGEDTIYGFQNNVDTLHLDDALWSQLGVLTVQEVLDEFATVVVFERRQAVLLDFGDGDTIVFNRFATISALADDILIV